jgi:hypothetical protein
MIGGSGGRAGGGGKTKRPYSKAPLLSKQPEPSYFTAKLYKTAGFL